MVARTRGQRTSLLAILLLTSLAAILGYAVVFLSTAVAQADQAEREYRNYYLLALGVLGLAYWISARRWPLDKGPGRALQWLALLLPCYAALQLLPLPLFVLRVASPARAELLDALAPLLIRPRFAPLSVVPPITLVHFMLFASYAVVFVLVRGIASRSASPWLPVFPVIAIAAWQGAWGLAQYLGGGPDGYAHGTYPVRNHFAGFLEMSLPFALASPLSVLWRALRHGRLSPTSALKACAGFASAAFVLLGIICSLSRMGFLATMCSLAWMGALFLIAKLQGRRRWYSVALLSLAVVIGLALVAPVPLVLRFAEHSTEGRLDVWRETLPLIAAYPLFGCGLGGYESAFQRFKTSGLLVVQDYAHNDYLQLLAEMGGIGFSIAAAFLFLIVARSIRASLGHPEADWQWLGVACSGALVAILVHSVADFNLYVPANACLLAWICGLAAGIPRNAAVGNEPA